MLQQKLPKQWGESYLLYHQDGAQYIHYTQSSKYYIKLSIFCQ